MEPLKELASLESAFFEVERFDYSPTKVERRVDADTSVLTTTVKQEDPDAEPVIAEHKLRDMGINNAESVSLVQENTQEGRDQSEFVKKALTGIEGTTVSVYGVDFSGRTLGDERIGGKYSKSLAQVFVNQSMVDERYTQHMDPNTARALSALNPESTSRYQYQLVSPQEAEKYQRMRQEVTDLAQQVVQGKATKEDLHAVLSKVLADPLRIADAEMSYRLYKYVDGDEAAAKAQYEAEQKLGNEVVGMSEVQYRKAAPPDIWDRTLAAFRNDNTATMLYNWVEDTVAENVLNQTQELDDDVLVVGIEDPQDRAAILARRNEVGDAAAANLRERVLNNQSDESILSELSMGEALMYRGAATLFSPEMAVGGIVYKPLAAAFKGAGRIKQHMAATTAIAAAETLVNESAKFLDETRDYTIGQAATNVGLATVAGGVFGTAIGKYTVSKHVKNLQKQRQRIHSQIRANKAAANTDPIKDLEGLLNAHAKQDLAITAAKAEMNPAAKVAGKAFGSSRHDVMANSKNPVTRMIGHLLMEDPIGTGGRVASSGSAALRAVTISEGARVIPAGIYKQALHQFQSRKGSMWVSRWASAQQSGAVNDGVREFNEAVIRHINAQRLGKQSNAPLEIQEYAASLETMYKELTDRAQRAGIFRKGGHTANNIDTHLKATGIRDAIGKYGGAQVNNRLVKAILDGDNKITDPTIAVAQAKSMILHALHPDTVPRPSGYTMHLDVDGILDLVDTELQEIIGRSVSRKSGDIAISEVSQGVFKSQSALKKAIDAVDDPAEKQLIKDAIALVRGQSIEGGGIANPVADVRDAVVANRMGGLATDAVGEAGQTFTRLTQQLFADPVKTYKALGMAVGKGEGKKLMKQTQELTKLMDNMMDLERMSVRIEDTTDLSGIDKTASALGWATNKLTGGKLRPVAGRMLGVTGGYNAISSFLRRANTASLMQDMAAHFKHGKGVMSLERMKGGGIVDDAGQNTLLHDMFNNVVTYNRKGGIKDLNVAQWSPEAKDQLQIIFKKDNMLNQQRLLAGENAPWQDKTIWKIASLFHEGTITATRKQTASNLAYADPEAGLRVALNQMTSTLALGVRAGLAGTAVTATGVELPDMELPEFGETVKRNSVLGYVPTAVALAREVGDPVSQGEYAKAADHIGSNIQMLDFLNQVGGGTINALTEEEREAGLQALNQSKLLHTMLWMQLLEQAVNEAMK